MSSAMPELPDERCENCFHAQPAYGDESGIMRAADWLQCDLMRSWQYCSPVHMCHFDPSKWTSKP
jgi:hypothetical protein